MAFKIADGYVDIHGRVDRRDVRRAAQRAGQQAGKSFGDAMDGELGKFLSKFRSAFRRMVPTNWLTFAPVAVVAAAALAKLSARVVGLTGHLATALPAAAALIPVLGGLGTAALAMIRAWDQSEVMHDALERIDDIIARETVPAIDTLGRLVERITPRLERHFGDIGDAMQAMADRLTAAFDERGLGGKLTGLLDAMATSAYDLGSVFSDLVEIIVTIGDAASGAAERFTGWLADVVEGWRDFLNLKSETGELAAFFDEAADRLAQWGRIFGNVIGALAGMLAAAAGPGAAFADSLERLTAAWREWSWDEGKGQIRDFLERLGNIDVSRIFEVAASITAIGVALKTLSGLTNMVAGFALIANMGPVAVTLATIATAIGLLAGAFAIAFQNSEAFRGAMRELWDFLVNTIGPAVEAFAGGFMEQFIPAVDTAAGIVTNDLIPALQAAITELDAALSPIGGIEGAMRMLGRAVGWAAGRLLEDFVQSIVAVVDFGATLIGWLETAVDAVQGFASSASAAWRRFAGAVGRAVGAVIGFIQRAIDFIGRLIGRITSIPTMRRTNYSFRPGGALGAIGSIIDAIARIPRYVSTVHSVTRSGGGSGGGGFAAGGVSGAQAGGARGGLAVVGEQGPELVRLPFGSRVFPASNTSHMRDRQPAGGGTRTVELHLHADGTRASRALMEIIREGVRVRGGDVQVVLGNG